MSVYGNEFSFTPDEVKASLMSMMANKLPGASFSDLMGLRKASATAENKALAGALSAPFSSSTRTPFGKAPYDTAVPSGDFRPSFPAGKGTASLPSPGDFAPSFPYGKGTPPALGTKQFAERIQPEATSKQFTSRLPASYTGPTEAPVYTPGPTPAASPIAAPRPIASIVAPVRGLGPTIRDYERIREGGDRRFADLEPRRERGFGGDRVRRLKKDETPTTGTTALNDGGMARGDGRIYRGKTKGRYI